MTQPDSASDSRSEQPGPLVTDLDGTLIEGDLLWEGIIAILAEQPWRLLLLPFWLLGGRAHLKARVAESYTPNPALLPYKAEAVDYCRSARAAGRDVILASASPRQWVEPVAAHLGLFTTVLASGPDRNLKGREKLKALQDEIGTASFTYMGDSKADAPLWEAAEEAIGSGPSSSAAAILRAHPNAMALQADARPSRARAAIRVLRPRQWTKNLLVFIPLILAHQLQEMAKLGDVAISFVLFSAVASAGYIFNDLLDLQSDRNHANKRNRPIASGDLPVPHAFLLLAGVLIATILAVSAWAPPLVGLMLAIYVVATFSYSLYLKQVLLVDVILLAGLYTHRILTGGVAARVEVSPWLLAFSAFFFLSLAFVKRYLELRRGKDDGSPAPGRRAYAATDVDLVESMGLICGFISIVVLCLFISGSEVTRLYAAPGLLWLMCPVMFYWIARIWFLARRGEVDEDPVLFATRDPKSYLAGLAVLAIIAAAAKW
ncbi:MAG: UbiA family prenyltransferase [Myxococcota bacterium]|nr:UbiA family prenyltransferase [Myxococcota bacterium]